MVESVHPGSAFFLETLRLTCVHTGTLQQTHRKELAAAVVHLKEYGEV